MDMHSDDRTQRGDNYIYICLGVCLRFYMRKKEYAMKNGTKIKLKCTLINTAQVQLPQRCTVLCFNFLYVYFTLYTLLW
jgi:hypothetical protein